MFDSKFNGILTVLLIIAIIGIFALIGYFGWSVYSKYSIKSNAEDVVSNFEETVKNKKEEEENRVQIGEVDPGNSIYDNSSNGEIPKYYGYEIIGTISIPKINIKYPILRKVNNTIY